MDQLFDIIVKLNSNKILGRLGSKKFQRPAYMTKIREPLTTRLRHMIHTLNQTSSVIRGGQDLVSLKNQIHDFEASFRRLEEADAENAICHTKIVIQKAYQMTGNGIGFPGRLKGLGYPALRLDDRDVREVGKISNYWRISRYLTHCSRRFRLQFAGASWYAIQSYRASSTSAILQRRFVHAEIQIVAYYEKMALKAAPRMIGVSKEACFLCDSFIRAHTLFSISGAHRQMVSQWTVPDLEEYSPNTILRFRRALSKVCEDVTKEYIQSQQKRSWRPFPLQSAINLDMIDLPTPSVSTIHNKHSSNGVGASVTHTASTISSERLGEQIVHENKQDVNSDIVKCSTEELQECEKQNDNEQELDEVRVDIAIDNEVSSCAHWIDIIATCSPTANSQSPGPSSEVVRGSISLEPVSRIRRPRIIRVEDIPMGDGLTLARDADDVPYEILFVLTGRQGEKIQVRCQWPA
jgi:hypothetical protein